MTAVTLDARERWRLLPKDSPRDDYFRLLYEAVREHYLADPSNPFQQSGRGSGAERWEVTRRCLMRAIHRSGDFLDVGCANGLLLESLIAWAREELLVLQPHGIDFVPELIDLARRRFPAHPDSFIVGNAFLWSPDRQYDFVRTNLEYVPLHDWDAFVRHQHAMVKPGGRLILCHYRSHDEPYVDPAAVAERAGFSVAGTFDIPGTAIAWIDRIA
jgi:2-polyprenyl-3-methyl-5-hydroxy-6-metoxy-1,4-benzoquinol methylase